MPTRDILRAAIECGMRLDDAVDTTNFAIDRLNDEISRTALGKRPFLQRIEINPRQTEIAREVYESLQVWGLSGKESMAVVGMAAEFHAGVLAVD